MSLTTVRTPIICLLLALLVTATLGPVSAAHADEKGQEVVTLRIAADAPMEEFLAATRTATGYMIVWDPSDKQVRGKQVKGDIGFRGTPQEVFARVRALLTFYELVMIRVGPKAGQMYLVMDARRTSSILKLNAEFVDVNAGNVASFDDMHGHFVTTTIQVQHMTDLRNARMALSRIVTGQNIGSVTEVADAKAFVVTDFAPNVASIWRLLKAMDIPAVDAGRTLAAITLSHAKAEDAAVQLRALFPPTVTSRAPTSRGAPAKIRPTNQAHFAADERTKQIVVNATPAQMEHIRSALKLIDKPAPKVATIIEIMRVEHIDSRHVAETLARISQRTSSLWSDPTDPGSAPTLVPTPSSDSLLISGTPAAITTLRRLLQQMDEEAGGGETDEK